MSYGYSDNLKYRHAICLHLNNIYQFNWTVFMYLQKLPLCWNMTDKWYEALNRKQIIFQISVFFDILLYGLVDSYQHSRGPYLHLRWWPHNVSSQKTKILIFVAWEHRFAVKFQFWKVIWRVDYMYLHTCSPEVLCITYCEVNPHT